jgi:hypothetical protein
MDSGLNILKRFSIERSDRMIIQKLYRSINSLRSQYLNKITYKAEIRNIDKKEPLWSKVELSPEQESEIKEYWKSISGYDIETKWHRLYQSYMGVYEKKYFPEILFSTKLEPMLSPAKYHSILSDKGLITSIFPGGGYRTPTTFVYNCNGVLTGSEHDVLTESEAIKRMSSCGKAIIKPTVDTSSGVGVRLVDMRNGIDERSGEKAADILKGYKVNYIVQECVEQSRYLSTIYSGSLNTFRVITYICEGEVYLAPLSMRIGSGGAFVDNIHAGGLSIGINSDFTLRKYAFTEMGDRFEQHPDTGVLFDGYAIPPLADVTRTALQLHGRLPQIKMISWDWSIDKNDDPVLIEINISGQSVWFPQMLNGEPIFGDNTEYFADLIRRK